MKKLTLVISCVFLLTSFVAPLAWGAEDEVIVSIVEARAKTKTFALPSAKLPDLTVEKAYALQKKLAGVLVANGNPIAGFKAGLTSAPAQKKFGVNAPLLGPLFTKGERKPGAALKSGDYVKLFVENEIGYVVGKEISQPVKDVDALKKMIKALVPAIELPDLRFGDLKNLKGTDIIVDAVASAGFIVGAPTALDKVDVNKVAVTMTLDGKAINKGTGTDALGDQWKALLWLVNGVVKQGWSIKPGQILITGALGRMLPGKPGKYEVDFGSLGKIAFSIQ